MEFIQTAAEADTARTRSTSARLKARSELGREPHARVCVCVKLWSLYTSHCA